ncbi:MAG: hypothetical protein Kow0062_00890 [Acidobacteriota bacterium]
MSNPETRLPEDEREPGGGDAAVPAAGETPGTDPAGEPAAPPDAPDAEQEAPADDASVEREIEAVVAAGVRRGVIDLDAAAAKALEWGHIDDEGNVRQNDNRHFAGRVIGRIRGRDPRRTLAFFVDRFRRFSHRVDQLLEQIDKDTNKGRYSQRLQKLREQIVTSDALGDFDALLDRLDAAYVEVQRFQAEQKALKEQLCERAEQLSSSTEWKKTTEAMKQLQQEWRTLGSASPADDDALWKRFRAAMDAFFSRRQQEREQARARQDEIRARKIALCEQAEALADSTDWKQTSERQAELMAEWKAAGWAGRAAEKELWERFRAARARFFERRREDREKRRAEFAENEKRKIALCEAAEVLIDSPDIVGTCEQAKLLQAEWKEIGPVPRARSEELWKRFRAACNAVFERARKERDRERAQRGRQQREQSGRRREQAETLRESIVRDLDHLDRWKRALDGMDAGADSPMRRQLAAQIDSIARQLDEKKARLAELEARLRESSSGP